jgi:hypothetical protein
MGGEDTPRRRQQAQGASPLPSGTVPHRTGHIPGHGPFVPGRVGPVFISGSPSRSRLKGLSVEKVSDINLHSTSANVI